MSNLLVGATTTIEVTALDDFGNLDQGVNGIVRLIIAGATTVTQDVALVGGSAQYQYSQNTPGSVAISLSDINSLVTTSTATSTVIFRHGSFGYSLGFFPKSPFIRILGLRHVLFLIRSL